jgi:hypothetical protein
MFAGVFGLVAHAHQGGSRFITRVQENLPGQSKLTRHKGDDFE